MLLEQSWNDLVKVEQVHSELKMNGSSKDVHVPQGFPDNGVTCFEWCLAKFFVVSLQISRDNLHLKEYMYICL